MALRQRRHLCDELAARGLDAQGVIVADDENLEIADDFGFSTVECDNSALGRRFNAGYRFVLGEGADYVVHIGSDDWMHPDCFDRLDALDALGGFPDPKPGEPVVMSTKSTPMLAGREMLVVDLVDGRGSSIRPRGQYGVVPWILPARAFDANPVPVDDHLQRGIDGSLLRGLGRTRPVFHDPHPAARVDFKSDVNVTPFTALTHIGEPCDPWPLLAEHYPSELVDEARDLSETLVTC